MNGTRYVPVELIDVAGLVPGAHEGKGLGNKFLDDLRQADALIHVIDASGGTDVEGNPCPRGSHDPLEDVGFLETEIDQWLKGILSKNWRRISKKARMNGTKLETVILEQFTGLGVSREQVLHVLNNCPLPVRPDDWGDEELLRLAREIRKTSKPMIIAGNKCDIASKEILDRLDDLDDYRAIPTMAELELALNNATSAGLLRYHRGGPDFEVVDEEKLSDKQKKGLQTIRKHLEKWGRTGIQKCIEEAAYNLLDLIVVFPVEDENKLTDHNGRILPDAYLMKKGSTTLDLAFKIHTDLGKHFIRAIDARTKRVVGKEHTLNHGDVISIVSGR